MHPVAEGSYTKLDKKDCVRRRKQGNRGYSF